MKTYTQEEMQKMREFYQENGYLVIENFASPEEVKKLQDRMKILVDEFFNRDESNTKSIFHTHEEQKRDLYFIESGDKVRFFYEEHAFDKDGNLIVPKDRSINKVGHALGELDPIFRDFTLKKEACDLVKGLGMKEPMLAQSMYIFKVIFLLFLDHRYQ
eukprot:TRINITY_DN564_c0_g1_i1.p1 TRINITY_DN564_c0_g1~~TRINITY_DN564_c0_g1_i1.p1  ORF type:complete len:159 (+),score=41.75 TRINITY_DN564_c0_g1_i1:79-555(+)